jgi:fructokinase
MTRNALGSEAIARKTRILSFGEVLWDVVGGREFLGGSAANVAYHAAQLGADSQLISRVGSDERGRLATAQLHRAGVGLAGVQRDTAHPTGTVQVTFENGEPHFEIGAQAAWDFIAPPLVLRPYQTANVLCFSTLAQRAPRSRSTLREILYELGGTPDAQRPTVIVDLNLRPPFVNRETILTSLHSADIVKLNDDELIWLNNCFAADSGPAFLLERFRLRWVLVTHGSAGASIYGHSLHLHQPAIPARSGDVVGAGDAFVAAFAVLLGGGRHPLDSLKSACDYASWVASESGAMPALSNRTPRL